MSNDDGISTDGSESVSHPFHGTNVAVERVVTENSAKGRAVMVKAAIGEDSIKRIEHLKITDNKAEDASAMIDHQVLFEVLKYLLERQETQ